MTYTITKSPLSVEKITAGNNSFSAVRLYNGRIYYTESRTFEQGRTTIVSCNYDGTDTCDELPVPYSVKSRINVYGGVCLCVCPHGIVFADGHTQNLYLVKHGDITVLVDVRANYGDVMYCPHSDRLVYIAEDLSDNANQRIDIYDFQTQTISTVAVGADFYHAPQMYNDRVAWLQWDKQHMPWDNSQIIECIDGVTNIVSEGCGNFQPNYDHEGVLHYACDRDGYFNIYKEGKNIVPINRDFAYPLWVYGMRTYDFIKDSIVACGVQNGAWELGVIHNETFAPYDTDAVTVESLVANDDAFAFIAGFKNKMPEIVCVHRGEEKCIATVGDTPMTRDYISIGHSISYQGECGDVQAYYYAPTNPEQIQENTPPLIVKSHGGPTGQTDNSYNNKIQFWTSRGFAVLDVNYSGSTGFGTQYRNRLNGRWGQLDVSDLERGALHLVEMGLADRDRLIISGSSAGGFSVLSALTFGDVFTVGCSIYGIGDLVGLAQETHKFESKYFDVLIGPFDAGMSQYIKRSPINHVEKLSVPVLFLQGLDDVVVPSKQSQAMYDGLYDKGIDTAMLLFKGEGHGFRNAKVVATALLAELDFYAQVLDMKHMEDYILEMNTTKTLDFSSE